MKVYVAGPYTKPDPIENTHIAIEMADILAGYGVTPYIPHLNAFWHLVYPKQYQFWLKYDMEWLLCCDALLRLPGESDGADKEVNKAKELGIPVYFELQDLLNNL